MNQRMARVAFVLPVLNAERLLPACLQSIRAQNYPIEACEILVADGGSTDRTREIAAAFGAIVLDNPQRRAEPGKQLAFSRSTADYIAFIDADNEIASPDWLPRGLAALQRHPDALGFESYYLKRPGGPALNHYVTALLQVSSDPLVRTLSRMPRLVEEEEGGVQIFELPASGNYPTGANGFIFRRDLLTALPGGQTFHEATFFPDLIRRGRRTLVKIRGCGVYHDYVSTWGDYLAKRRYTMVNYLLRKEEHALTWDSSGGAWRKALAVAYHASVLGPAAEGLVRAVRERDPEWLLHPAASIVSALGNLLGYWDYRKAGSREGGVRASVNLHRHASGHEQGPHGNGA